MNKTVFAYALNEIDDDLICKYAPGSFESVVYAHNKNSDKKIDMKSPEYADFNNWKNEILTKYAG